MIAEPPTAIEREPYVPMPNGMRPVSPWTISTLSSRDAEPVGHHLREGRLVPLAVTMRAGEHGDRAGGMHANLGRLRTGRPARPTRPRYSTARDRTPRCSTSSQGRAACRSSSDSSSARREAFDVREFERAGEDGLVIAGVVGEADRRRVRKLADEIAAANLRRIELHLARGRFHQPLHHVRRFGAARAAIGIDGNGVREDRFHLRVDRGRGVLAGEQRGVQNGRHARRERRQIRAHVGGRVDAHAEELAVRVHGQFGLGHVIAAVRVRDERFRALGRPLDRTADFLRRPRQRDVFRIQEDLRAEAAADVRRDHAQFRFRQRQHERGHQQALDVRILIRDVERVAVVLHGIARVDRARFDRVRDQAVVDDVERGDVRGLGEGGVGGGLVAVAPVVADVVRHVVVHERAGRRRRMRGIDHGRQHVVIDFDQFGGVLRGLDRIGDHERDLIADMAHFRMRDHRDAAARSSACRRCCGSASRTAGRRRCQPPCPRR